MDVPIVRVQMSKGSHLIGRHLQSVVPVPIRTLLVLPHLVEHKTQRSDDHGSRGRSVQTVADPISRTSISVDVAPSGSD